MLNSELEFDRLRREFGYCIGSLLVQSGDVLVIRDATKLEESVFSDAAQEEIARAVDSSWWYRVRNQIIVMKLKMSGFSGTLWDVGSGSGVVAEALAKAGIPAIAIGPSSSGALIAATRRIVSIQGTLQNLGLPDNCIAGIGAFDVLEHVTNRQDFLKEIARVLIPGGHLIITVPALKLLWSHSDIEAGHHIRYSRRSIRQELEEFGYEVTSLGYFFALTIVPLLLIRAIPFRLGFHVRDSKNSLLRTTGGAVGNLVGRLEVAMAGHVPIGSSLFVVARKPL